MIQFLIIIIVSSICYTQYASNSKYKNVLNMVTNILVNSEKSVFFHIFLILFIQITLLHT